MNKDNQKNRLHLNQSEDTRRSLTHDRPEPKNDAPDSRPAPKHGDDKTPLILNIICKCGEKMQVPARGWRINIIGTVQFMCPRCTNVLMTTQIW